MNSTSALDPTYYGFIGSTYDALVLFEACITGQVKYVSRRPHDLERERVIQSGSIFIYEENTSGIKRWTDGISWSPSRILGNFLIYRQLVKAFGPGEKKKAIKKPKAGPNDITKNNSNSKGRNKENISQAVNNLQATGRTYGLVATIKLETERALIGSLTDSYDFLENGLVKKTISINYGDATHHLVSYYTVSDAISQTFTVPSKDPRFASTYPRMSLLSSQNFRNAIEDIDPLDLPTYPRNRYEMTPKGFQQRQTSIVQTLGNYSSNDRTLNRLYSPNYDSIPITSTAYKHGLPVYNWTAGSANYHVAVPGSYPAPQKTEHHQGDYEQHFFATSSSKSEGSRASMPTVGILQRDVSLLYRRDSEDSGVSMSMDKMVNDLTFSHNQNNVYGFPRATSLIANSIPVLDTLPDLSQADFTGQEAYEAPLSNGQNYRVAMSLDKTGMRQLGNASAGHGHYQNV